MNPSIITLKVAKLFVQIQYTFEVIHEILLRSLDNTLVPPLDKGKVVFAYMYIHTMELVTCVHYCTYMYVGIIPYHLSVYEERLLAVKCTHFWFKQRPFCRCSHSLFLTILFCARKTAHSVPIHFYTRFVCLSFGTYMYRVPNIHFIIVKKHLC